MTESTDLKPFKVGDRVIIEGVLIANAEPLDDLDDEIQMYPVALQLGDVEDMNLQLTFDELGKHAKYKSYPVLKHSNGSKKKDFVVGDKVFIEAVVRATTGDKRPLMVRIDDISNILFFEDGRLAVDDSEPTIKHNPSNAVNHLKDLADATMLIEVDGVIITPVLELFKEYCARISNIALLAQIEAGSTIVKSKLEQEMIIIFVNQLAEIKVFIDIEDMNHTPSWIVNRLKSWNYILD